MTSTAIALAAVLALSSTAALAQSAASFGRAGTSVGTVTAPSVGSYYWPQVGTTNAVPTWNNTIPAERTAPTGRAPTTGMAPFGARTRG